MSLCHKQLLDLQSKGKEALCESVQHFRDKMHYTKGLCSAQAQIKGHACTGAQGPWKVDQAFRQRQLLNEPSIPPSCLRTNGPLGACHKQLAFPILSTDQARAGSWQQLSLLILANASLSLPAGQEFCSCRSRTSPAGVRSAGLPPVWNSELIMPPPSHSLSGLLQKGGPRQGPHHVWFVPQVCHW